jgi:hypothetical protein
MLRQNESFADAIAEEITNPNAGEIVSDTVIVDVDKIPDFPKG